MSDTHILPFATVHTGVVCGASRNILSVQGVGAKASLAILGALGADGVSRAIALGDWNAVKAAKGIGPKTAQKLIAQYGRIEHLLDNSCQVRICYPS